MSEVTFSSRALVPALPDLAERWLPAPLLSTGPYEMPWWQWLALPILLLIAVLVGKLVSAVAHHIFFRLAQQTRSQLDDKLAGRVQAPLGWMVGLGLWRLGVAALELPAAGRAAMNDWTRLGFFAVLFWMLLRLIDLGGGWLARSRWALNNALSQSIVPLATRIVKVMVVMVAVISLLSELGYPVASLIAGVGIGGLAIALAAQKTLGDLFGAFAIGFDQHLHQGDLVTVNGAHGTVESVGLRSTRIRSVEGTLVTVPNGKLADMQIESFSDRTRLRLNVTLHLHNATTATQMRAVMSGIQAALRELPEIDPASPSVHFIAVADAWLDVQVIAWFQTQDTEAFNHLRDDALLRCLEVVSQAGTTLASPAQPLSLLGIGAGRGEAGSGEAPRRVTHNGG